MNKAEFLKELKTRLRRLPQEEITRYATYYSELIDDMIEDGKSPCQAVASLEDMEVIIGRIYSEWPDIESPSKPKEEGENTLRYVIEELPESISIAWISGRVEIKPHDETRVVILESSKHSIEQANRLKYSIQSGILEIEEFSSRKQNVKYEKRLQVLTPHELYKDINAFKVSAVSADIVFDGMSGETVGLATVSGDIDCRGSFDTWSAETVSGDITIEDIKGGDSVKIKSVSGDIDCRGSFDTWGAETVSGDITIEDFKGVASVEIKSVSGAISLKGINANASLKTTSGNIALTPKTDDFEVETANARAKLDSGSYSLTIHQNRYISGRGGPVFKLKTTSGRLSLLGR